MKTWLCHLEQGSIDNAFGAVRVRCAQHEVIGFSNEFLNGLHQAHAGYFTWRVAAATGHDVHTESETKASNLLTNATETKDAEALTREAERLNGSPITEFSLLDIPCPLARWWFIDPELGEVPVLRQDGGEDIFGNGFGQRTTSTGDDFGRQVRRVGAIDPGVGECVPRNA